MIKTFYKRNQFFCNMSAVLFLITANRVLDRLVWTPPYPEKVRDTIADFLLEFLVFIPFVLIIISVYNNISKKNQKLIIISFTTLCLVFIPTIVLFITTWLQKTLLNLNPLPVNIELIERYTPGGFVIVLLICAAYYLTFLKKRADANLEKAYKAENLAKEVQLKMLRYQVNPHFLFNVLNSIHSLIDEDQLKAKKLVVDMSEYYRYTLDKQEQTVTIEREIDAVEKYLQIQKIRYEENFLYDIYVDDRARRIVVPSFIIHLLVENALKFGSKSKNQVLVVKLGISFSKNLLSIWVSNTGKLYDINSSQPKMGSDGTGSGIDNLKNRLSLYYNNDFSFSIKEEQGWVIAKIEINNPG